jgi:glycosyltransferase involved in cell wall biosynthesis
LNVGGQDPPLEVAMLSPRGCILGSDPCGGSEVVFWEDWNIFRDQGIPARAYAAAATGHAPISRIRLRTHSRLITSLEYCIPLLLKERRAFVIAYNEPTMAGLIPQRCIVRFDWFTALPRYWGLPGCLERFQRAFYLFPSDSERGLFLQHHPLIPRGSTQVIHNAVDLSLFRPVNSRNPAPRVGYAAQWSPGKGLHVLLEAWRLVKARLPEAELLLAGSGRLWKYVDAIPGVRDVVERVEAEAGKGLVQIVGEKKRSEMPKFWGSVNLAVVPSLYESFGMVALEALACGVPVVATDAGGLPDIIVDGECGVLVPAGSAPRLADALLGLLSNEPLRHRMAERARLRAEEFSSGRRAASLLALVASRARNK